MSNPLEFNLDNKVISAALTLEEHGSYSVPIGNTNTQIGAAQINVLYNSAIPVPPTDQLMLLDVDSQDEKLGSFLLAPKFFDEITAAAPVTWTSTATGTARVDQVINPTASRVAGNYRQFIVGNAFLHLGKSTGSNPTILWGVSARGFVLSMAWHFVKIKLDSVRIR